ncbi:metallophosphoesterase [Chloroflexi bacterium TSY]|nr:metallophosphoesterase [Chloroflexi bacterium TSY]
MQFDATSRSKRKNSSSDNGGPLANKGRIRSLFGGIGLLTGLGLGIASYALFREPLDINLDRLTIRLPGTLGRLPQRGLRILHLSDTHFQGLEWRERAKIKQIHRLVSGLQFDLLIHTGDFWHNEAGEANILSLLDGLPKPRLGSYGVLGNHDYACYSHGDAFTRNWNHYKKAQYELHLESFENGSKDGHGLTHAIARNITENGSVSLNPKTNGYMPIEVFTEQQFTQLDRLQDAYRFVRYFLTTPFELERASYNDTRRLEKILASRGVELLTNRSIHLQHNPGQPDGVNIHLAGIDDITEGAPELDSALAQVPTDATKILLSHNPDVLEDGRSREADVILSGHTHGGQINLPIVGAIHTHSAHLKRHEAAGYMWRDRTQVYVTRGVGEGIPLRFCAKPQITLITIIAES